MRNFLIKLKREGKLELVEPSKNISEGYRLKAKNCLRAAKILHQEALYENSISQSYYAMYNSIQACLFLNGIKCENHSAAIHLIGLLFHKPALQKKLLYAKEERIDTQYYITGRQEKPATLESSTMMVKEAESTFIELELLRQKILEEDVEEARKKVREI